MAAYGNTKPYQENSFFVGVICPEGRLRANSNTQGNYARLGRTESISQESAPCLQLYRS